MRRGGGARVTLAALDAGEASLAPTTRRGQEPFGGGALRPWRPVTTHPRRRERPPPALPLPLPVAGGPAGAGPGEERCGGGSWRPGRGAPTDTRRGERPPLALPLPLPFAGGAAGAGSTAVVGASSGDTGSLRAVVGASRSGPCGGALGAPFP